MSALVIQTTLSDLERTTRCCTEASPPPQHRTAQAASRHGAAAPTRTGKKSGLLLFVLLIAQLMVILDITAVNIALPSLAGDLDLTGSEHQLDDHELLAHLRQPAALRRPRRRPARTAPDVPDRPRHLHRILVRLGDGRHRRCPLRRSGRPGSRRRDALAGSARDHHVRLPGQPAGEGARRLGRSRRRRRRDRRARRRRPDRVHRLADDLLRQPPRRSRTRDRRTEDHPGRHPQAALEGSRPPRRRARDDEPRRDRLRDHAGRGRWLDFRPDAPVRPRRPRRPRCLRGARAAHRHTAPADRAAGRSRSRRRPLPDARRGRLDLRPLPAQLALPPERARHGGRSRPASPSSRSRSRQESARTRPATSSASTASAARSPAPSWSPPPA